MILPFMIPVFAEDVFEFNIDGYSVVSYNPSITEITLNWDMPNQLPSGTLTLSEQYTGTILIKIPKEMSRTMNVDFETSWGLFYPNGEMTQNITEIDSQCHYILSMKLDNSNFIEFGTVSVAAGNLESISIKNDTCKHKAVNDNYESWYNVRNDIVFVYPSSVEKLVQRGYLIETWA